METKEEFASEIRHILAIAKRKLPLYTYDDLLTDTKAEIEILIKEVVIEENENTKNFPY
jgi:hypothetical protein